MGQHDETYSSLANKVQKLQTSLELSRTREAHLQLRLIATLDALDTVQLSQETALDSEIRTRRRLADQLASSNNALRTMELERDDLKDAVNQLVEKVEASNNYSSWPYSRFKASALADPIPSDTHGPLAKPSHQDNDAVVYAASLIESLRRERDEERISHERTKRQAQQQMRFLEAKLARREAELERCVDHPHRNPTPPTVRSPLVMRDGDSISDDEAVILLERTASRNRQLELEVKELFRRLELARRTRSASPTSNTPRPTSPARRSPATFISQIREHHSIKPSPPLPAYPPRTARPHEGHHQITSNPPQIHDIITVLPPLSPQNIAVAAAVQNPIEPSFTTGHQAIVQLLDQQISQLNNMIARFVHERDALIRVIHNDENSISMVVEEQKRERRRYPGETLPDIEVGAQQQESERSPSDQSVIDGRRRSSPQDVPAPKRRDHVNVATGASDRPFQVMTQSPYEGVGVAGPSPDLQGRPREGEGVQLLDDDIYDGELSMELATPLLPVQALPSARSSRSRSRSGSNQHHLGLYQGHTDDFDVDEADGVREDESFVLDPSLIALPPSPIAINASPPFASDGRLAVSPPGLDRGWTPFAISSPPPRGRQGQIASIRQGRSRSSPSSAQLLSRATTPQQGKMKRLEAELEDARRRLEAGENEIRELHLLLEDL